MLARSKPYGRGDESDDRLRDPAPRHQDTTTWLVRRIALFEKVENSACQRLRIEEGFLPLMAIEATRDNTLGFINQILRSQKYAPPSCSVVVNTVTTRWPSGLNAALFTEPSCLRSTTISFPLAASASARTELVRQSSSGS
jgi:hypothetical protein